MRFFQIEDSVKVSAKASALFAMLDTLGMYVVYVIAHVYVGVLLCLRARVRVREFFGLSVCVPVLSGYKT